MAHRGKLGISGKLEQIRKVFDVDSVYNLHPDSIYIRRYYKDNRLPYTIFHNFSDQVHMGISRDGVYKPEDLLEGARVVGKYVEDLHATYVLELGTGRGATSSYLAERFPNTTFHGIDYSPGQLEYALKRAKRFKNYKPQRGDYHDLSGFQESSVSIIFAMEALCYSQDKQRVFNESSRILKPGGVFILFDAYSEDNGATLGADLKFAKICAERGMAVPEFEPYNIVLRKAANAGLDLSSDEDATALIMPTLRRFENLAKIFFNHPRLARIVSRIFPQTFLYNAMSGYLMPDLAEEGAGKYYITVLQKK